MKINCPHCNKEIHLSISAKIQGVNPKIGSKIGAKFSIVEEPKKDEVVEIIFKDKNGKMKKMKFKD